MRKKNLVAALCALLMLLLCSYASAAEWNDIVGHPAEAEIRQMLDAGYLAGYTDGTVRPDDTVTAAQLLTVLGRILGVDIASAPGENWYDGAFRAAQRLGYVTDALPDEVVTQKTALLALSDAFFGPSDTESPLLPAELNLSAAEKLRLSALYERGVVLPEELSPETPLSRAALSLFVTRALDGIMAPDGAGFTAEALEAALSAVTDQYAGDYTLAWAQAHDYPPLLKCAFFEALGKTSNTKYLLWVNNAYQRVNIFALGADGWRLDRVFLCSTGAPGTGTPTGTFKTTSKERGWFHATYEVYPVVRFYTRGYAFHSQLHVPGSAALTDAALGYPASHGCVRLQDADITWIYQNIPNGTTVVVH